MEHTGKTLCGRYRLDERIGAGGMGTVYAGLHLRLDRPVAVKLLKPEVSRDGSLVERFFREARTAASVNSIGIVDVIDLDVDPQLGPFMVMERLRGEALVDLLPRGALPPQRAVQIVADMLDVLAAVHAKGVVHRDLKPPNVFLHRTEDGKEIVKVLDFGIAQLSFARMTIEGAVIGTPRWMAPEQALGRSDVDHRADLYASGLLLYSALSGQPPYHDVPSREVGRYIERGPTPLRTLEPNLPAAVYPIVERALATDPAQRFQSATEMASLLRTLDLKQHTEASQSPEISANRVAPAIPSVRPAPPTPSVPPGAPSPHSQKLPRSAKWTIAIVVALVVTVALAVEGVVLWGGDTASTGPALLQLSDPIPSTCPIPTGELVGVASNGQTFVWTGAGNTLRITAPTGTHGAVPLNNPRVRIEAGPYRNSMAGGTITFHEFDPSRGRARVQFSNVTLFRGDGGSCTLFGVAQSF